MHKNFFQSLQDLHTCASLQTQHFSRTSVKNDINQQFSWKFQQNVGKFRKIQFSESQIFQKCFVDFLNCWKTRIYTPPLGGQKTQAYCLAPQRNLLTGCVSKPFSKQMWRPEMRWCDDGMRWCRDDEIMGWWNHRMMEAIFGPFFMDFRRKY